MRAPLPCVAVRGASPRRIFASTHGRGRGTHASDPGLVNVCD
ncbi:hypothetical protein HMPREF0970_01114 [Schaalia odontolytica F0309]|uniref:Uncharacterized protein n=1 Tax=Schaalia odontolytica F0309 TaxID=649742 RepID=D4TYT6_9ACTO|nr:hypothetical protein HMPREF0970_01114 [Schaalia odontolytica F0309]